MFDSFSAIADLQAKWHTLKDLDRAAAVQPIIHSGVSRRSLATALNCSEPLIRRLLLTLEASPQDRALARQGAISTNELVRRVKTTITPREAKQPENLELKRAISARQGARTILEWLAEESFIGPYNKQIIAEAQRILMQGEQPGTLPQLSDDLSSKRSFEASNRSRRKTTSASLITMPAG